MKPKKWPLSRQELMLAERHGVGRAQRSKAPPDHGMATVRARSAPILVAGNDFLGSLTARRLPLRLILPKGNYQ
jgi:hypothetical protein